MLLTIGVDRSLGENSAIPATDLGFVLHKHPDRTRVVSTVHGSATAFWPEAGEDRASVAVLVDVDPVTLVRGGDGTRSLAPYINDRPYVASSLLSVAIGKLFRSALNGACEARPELVATPWHVTVDLPTVPVGGDPGLVRQLFEPLGYRVELAVPPLDPAFPDWGPAPVADVRLEGSVTMQALLRHLYVLLPVLDNDKHYWIDESEVAKLLRQGAGWLADHPGRELITRRYLGNFPGLTKLASELLGTTAAAENGGPADRLVGDSVVADDRRADAAEANIEKPLSLNTQRIDAVIAAVAAWRPSSVIDLGCGEGRLLGRLAEDSTIDRLVGIDVSITALQRSRRRLRLDRRPEKQRPTVELWQSPLTYRDRRLEGFDVACLIEVIEHIDPVRLEALETMLFRYARPRALIVTTPNREYNRLFNMAPDALRHQDHRFEWTRAEFERWCVRIAAEHNYEVSFEPIGPVDDEAGAPTQMAIMARTGGGDADEPSGERPDAEGQNSD